METYQWLAVILMVTLNLIGAAYSYGSLNQSMRSLKEQVIGQRDDLRDHTRRIEDVCTRVTEIEARLGMPAGGSFPNRGNYDDRKKQ